MTKISLAVIALAFAFSAITPASAKMSCDKADMVKANSMMMAMPDGDKKMGIYKEMTMANQAVSKGMMKDCTMHIRKVEGMMK